MLVGLHVATNFEMYRVDKTLKKHYWGGGGGGNCLPALPPSPPPPSATPNGWQCQGSRYNDMAGNLARDAN